MIRMKSDPNRQIRKTEIIYTICYNDIGVVLLRGLLFSRQKPRLRPAGPEWTRQRDI